MILNHFKNEHSREFRALSTADESVYSIDLYHLSLRILQLFNILINHTPNPPDKGFSNEYSKSSVFGTESTGNLE